MPVQWIQIYVNIFFRDTEKESFKLWKSTGRFNLKLFTLFADVEKYLSKKGRILIGYSGGLDSTVLLTLASEYFTSKKVLAVHINHGLSPNAENWQSFVVAYCKFLSVDYSVQRVEINESANQEAMAREARFGVFSKLLKKGDVLLLGHHLDDQIETVIYRLLRGCLLYTSPSPRD